QHNLAEFGKPRTGRHYQLTDELLQVAATHVFNFAFGSGALFDQDRIGEDLGERATQELDTVGRNIGSSNHGALRLADLLTELEGPRLIVWQDNGFGQGRHVR